VSMSDGIAGAFSALPPVLFGPGQKGREDIRIFRLL